MYELCMDLHPNFAYSGYKVEMTYESFDEAWDRMAFFMKDHPAFVVVDKSVKEYTTIAGETSVEVTEESGHYSHLGKNYGIYSIKRV